MRNRLLGIAAAVLTVSGTAVIASSGTADAAVVGRCTGTVQQPTYPIRSATGDTIGRAELWYKPDNGGTNCVMVWNYLGKVASLTATLTDEYNGRNQRAPGRFKTYSDGAQLADTNHHCVSGSGSIVGDNASERGSVTIPRGHCG